MTVPPGYEAPEVPMLDGTGASKKRRYQVRRRTERIKASFDASECTNQGGHILDTRPYGGIWCRHCGRYAFPAIQSPPPLMTWA